MQIGGERFNIDLDDTDDEQKPAAPKASPFDLVGEVKERNDVDKTPLAPTLPNKQNGSTGFPAHKKRMVMSRFKAQQQEAAAAAKVMSPPPVLTEKQQIDHENRDRLAHMSESEIAEMKQDLMGSLNPTALQRLLAKSYIDHPEQSTDFPGLEDKPMDKPEPATTESKSTENDHRSTKKVSFAPEAANDEASASPRVDEYIPQPPELDPQFTSPDAPSIHWPKPSQPPSLDPSAPSFLEDLHKKYFPDLPAEPEKLEWMKDDPGANTYKPEATGLDPKDIRFSFAGALIPPTLAAKIPVTAGLHHHGAAPDAAGYTIEELSILARSSVAAQRCMAFQTLGRILFRLGKGEFGNPSEDRPDLQRADQLGELARGLWDEVQKHAVVDICVNESEGRGPSMGRHASARAYATEAVWLWQKGGGRRWTAA